MILRLINGVNQWDMLVFKPAGYRFFYLKKHYSTWLISIIESKC